MVSVWRGFLFLWVLGMSYVILLWHSLSLPYNYFVDSTNQYSRILLTHSLVYIAFFVSNLVGNVCDNFPRDQTQMVSGQVDEYTASCPCKYLNTNNLINTNIQAAAEWPPFGK